MIIKRLTLKNFGVYAGTNTFEFSLSKPIVLIGGMNGRGKTTFLEAILLALYGSNSTAYKESSYKTYGKYLRSYVNKSSWDQTTSVELEFVMNESSQSEYLVHREWSALGKKTEEVISVCENGNYSEFLTKNWPMFVENILPSALSRFFFFDGEKIAELAVDDTNAQMKESIRSMLGISVLDVLKNDLSRVLKRLVKSASREDTSALEILRVEKETLEASLESIETKLNDLQKQISVQQDSIDELHHQYEIHGGDVIDQRQSLIEQRSELLAEIDQNQSALLECAAGELPLLLVQDLISDIKLQAEDEHDDLVMQQAIGLIEDLLSEYSAVHQSDAEINAKFLSFVKDETRAGVVNTIYEVSDHALFQLNSLLDTLLAVSKKNTQQLLTKKKDLKRRADEIDSYLSLDINDKVLSNLFATIRKQENVLVGLKLQHSALEQEKASIGASLVSKSSEYSRAVEAYLQNAESYDDAERMEKYSTMALRLAEEYTVELQRKKTDVLGATITACYKKLANKKNLIQRITMDPENLDITYWDEFDQSVAKDSLSAGEKQLMVIAILWALAICSKKKLPVIIDTPLSRLDSMHRAALVRTYFPNASDQTIILSTDSEIDHNYYQMMEESIGDEFTLCYSETSKSTTILKGYFQNYDN